MLQDPPNVRFHCLKCNVSYCERCWNIGPRLFDDELPGFSTVGMAYVRRATSSLSTTRPCFGLRVDALASPAALSHTTGGLCAPARGPWVAWPRLVEAGRCPGTGRFRNSTSWSTGSRPTGVHTLAVRAEPRTRSRRATSGTSRPTTGWPRRKRSPAGAMGPPPGHSALKVWPVALDRDIRDRQVPEAARAGDQESGGKVWAMGRGARGRMASEQASTARAAPASCWGRVFPRLLHWELLSSRTGIPALKTRSTYGAPFS